jgi:hypothetical protein
MNAQALVPVPTAVIVAGHILGLYSNHRQVESFRNEFNAKIAALRAETKQGFAEVRLSLARRS